MHVNTHTHKTLHFLISILCCFENEVLFTVVLFNLRWNYIKYFAVIWRKIVSDARVIISCKHWEAPELCFLWTCYYVSITRISEIKIYKFNYFPWIILETGQRKAHHHPLYQLYTHWNNMNVCHMDICNERISFARPYKLDMQE
jgi:hypothetical protein